MSEHETGVQPTPEQTDLERANRVLDGGTFRRHMMAESRKELVNRMCAEFARVREEMKEQCANRLRQKIEAIERDMREELQGKTTPILMEAGTLHWADKLRAALRSQGQGK